MKRVIYFLLSLGGSLIATGRGAALRGKENTAAIVIAIGGGCLLLGLVLGLTVGRADAQQTRRNRRRALWVVLSIVGMVGAYAGSSMYWEHVYELCSAINQAPTLQERHALLDRAQDAERIPFHGLRLLVEGQGLCSIPQAEALLADEEFITRGECPKHLVPGQTCRCGDRRIPDDMPTCQKPHCSRYNGLVTLDCFDAVGR